MKKKRETKFEKFKRVKAEVQTRHSDPPGLYSIPSYANEGKADAEIEAMRAVLSAMLPLKDNDQRERVLYYIRRRLGL